MKNSNLYKKRLWNCFATQCKLILFTGVIVMFTTTSCERWLDVLPVTEVPEETMYVNEQGFFEVLSGIYVDMADSRLYGGELTFGLLDALAQRYPVGTSFRYQNIMGTPGGFDYNSDGSRRAYIDPTWSQLYALIGNTNNLLENIEQRRAVFTGDHYALVKGQALALRAFFHFDLLRIYAPVKDEEGVYIPYVTQYKPRISNRLKVRSVIDSCLRDLDEAETLLAVDKNVRDGEAANVFLSYTRNKMNYYAIAGLKARMYLYAGKKLEAYNQAKKVIADVSNKFPFVKQAEVLEGDRTFVKEQLFSLYVQDMLTNYQNFFIGEGRGLGVRNSTLSAIFELSGSKKTTDYRYLYQWTPASGGMAVFDKFSQKDLSKDKNYGLQMPLIRLSEMYYIAAEAAPDFNEGTSYLKTVRENRGLVGVNDQLNVNNETALADEIRKEYTKEFYGEGQLFFYYKRRGFLTIPTFEGTTVLTPQKVYTWPLPLAELQGR